MSRKQKPTETEAKIKALQKVVKDKSLPKKARKAAKAEIEALSGVFVPTSATGGDTAGPSAASADVPASSPDGSGPEIGDAWREKQDAEVARQWAHHRAQRADPTGIAADLIVEDGLREVGEQLAKALDRNLASAEKPLEAPTPAEAVIAAQTIAETLNAIPEPQEAQVVETDHGREIVVGAPFDPLEAPVDPVLENGNGQPIIHYLDPATGKEKTKGYTRVTTYIKGLEDTSVLEKWKMRTLLEGAAVELLQNQENVEAAPSIGAVARAVKRLDEALADIDRRERTEGELLELRRQELVKEHKDHLDKIAEDLLELGGAHEKANKGTNLHRLTQIVDEGGTLPADTTASDRRDVEAYQETMKRLGIEVLWCERRVVLDDIQVSGTMDRAYMVKLPGMQRRSRVVGDLKTGSVTWGAGKIGMQLALYARGLGYDWTKPLERERLSLSQRSGLLVHLPQGEGVCTVYEVDLELAGKGLALAREVREWRNTGKRVYDLKKPLGAS